MWTKMLMATFPGQLPPMAARPLPRGSASLHPSSSQQVHPQCPGGRGAGKRSLSISDRRTTGFLAETSALHPLIWVYIPRTSSRQKFRGRARSDLSWQVQDTKKPKKLRPIMAGIFSLRPRPQDIPFAPQRRLKK